MMMPVAALLLAPPSEGRLGARATEARTNADARREMSPAAADALGDYTLAVPCGKTRSEDGALPHLVEPIIIEASPEIPRSLVRRLVDEAAETLRMSGFVLDRPREAASAQVHGPTVRVAIGDEDDGGDVRGAIPIGWIELDRFGVPQPVIHLSRTNTVQLLDTMAALHHAPPFGREFLMGRALGRALAHELGHYLTGSREHSRTGLMRARHPGDTFFATIRGGLTLTGRQRTLIARRCTGPTGRS
jgi:hypothetical protein